MYDPARPSPDAGLDRRAAVIRLIPGWTNRPASTKSRRSGATETGFGPLPSTSTSADARLREMSHRRLTLVTLVTVMPDNVLILLKFPP
jgi:hypothetical protein